MSAGYSKTPLAKKLGIKEGFSMILHNPPKHYFDLFMDLPENLTLLKKAGEQEVDFAHIFCTLFDDLYEIAEEFKNTIKKSGMLWISWPKGSSNIPTDLKRDTIREYLLAIGLVDVKVAAIDEDWSGLKFVYRLMDRG